MMKTGRPSLHKTNQGSIKAKYGDRPLPPTPDNTSPGFRELPPLPSANQAPPPPPISTLPSRSPSGKSQTLPRQQSTESKAFGNKPLSTSLSHNKPQIQPPKRAAESAPPPPPVSTLPTKIHGGRNSPSIRGPPAENAPPLPLPPRTTASQPPPYPSRGAPEPDMPPPLPSRGEERLPPAPPVLGPEDDPILHSSEFERQFTFHCVAEFPPTSPFYRTEHLYPSKSSKNPANKQSRPLPQVAEY